MENETAADLLEQADRLYSSGQLKQAMRLYQEVLEQDSQVAWAHSRIGAILAQQGDLSAAEEAFKRALELKPDLAQAHSNLGNIYFSRREFPAALEKYKEAADLDPDNPVFHQNLHAAYKKLGNLSAAISALKKANKLSNKEAQAESRVAFETMKKKAKRGGCLSVLAVTLTLVGTVVVAVALL